MVKSITEYGLRKHEAQKKNQDITISIRNKIKIISVASCHCLLLPLVLVCYYATIVVHNEKRKWRVLRSPCSGTTLMSTNILFGYNEYRKAMSSINIHFKMKIIVFNIHLHHYYFLNVRVRDKSSKTIIKQ